MIFIDFFCLQRLKFNSLDNIVISSQEVKDYNSNWRLFPNEDALRHFASQSNNPESWIDENGQLNPLRVETHKTYIESMDAIYDQDKDVSLVSNIGEWFDGIGKEFEDYQGTKYQTMAYSLPTWGLFYVIALNAEKVDADGNTCLPYDAGYDACEVKGNWGMASGPNSYYWGGSYIGIYEGSVIKEVAYDFISSMLFDDERMIQRAENGDVYSRISIMEEITSQHQGNDVLGGMNEYQMFLGMALSITAMHQTEYDLEINSILEYLLHQYLRGNIDSVEDLITDFYNQLSYQYPSLIE